MEKVNRFENLGLAGVILLLVVAIVGPWNYTGDGLPPPEYCYEPNFLLSSGNCAEATSGIWVMGYFIAGFFYLVGGLFTGEVVFPARQAEFFNMALLALLAILVLLPFLTTALRATRPNTRRLHRVNLAAWGLGGILCLLQVAFINDLFSLRFWGLWLYLALAASVLVLEGMGVVKRET